MASVGAGGVVRFDPESVQSSASSVQNIANAAAGLRQKCASHHRHAQGILGELGQLAIMELDPAAHEHIWGDLGFDSLRAAIEGTQNELGGLRTQLDGVRKMLLDTHSGPLGSKLQDEFEPLSACLAESHSQAASASGLVIFENLVGIALGYVDLPMALFLTEVATGRACDEADALHSVLGWLGQQEIGLVNLTGTSIRNLWNWAFDHPAKSAVSGSTGSAQHAKVTPTPTTAPSTSHQIVAEATTLAGGLQYITLYDSRGKPYRVYNSYLKADGTNTYPGDQAFALSVLPSGPWSWADIQCVAFVTLVYAETFPHDWRKIMLPIGNSSAGTGTWAAYGTTNARKLGWQEIPNDPKLQTGLKPQAGDIIVMQARDAKGNDLSWGHVAIVQSISQPTVSADGHTHAYMTILQSNSSSPSATLTMTDGMVDTQPQNNNFITLGYLHYTPTTP